MRGTHPYDPLHKHALDVAYSVKNQYEIAKPLRLAVVETPLATNGCYHW
jgi:hypothetical protein